MIAENFPNLGKETDMQAQKVQTLKQDQPKAKIKEKRN